MSVRIGEVVCAEDPVRGEPVPALVLTVVDGVVLDLCSERGEILSRWADWGVP